MLFLSSIVSPCFACVFVRCRSDLRCVLSASAVLCAHFTPNFLFMRSAKALDTELARDRLSCAPHSGLASKLRNRIIKPWI